MISRDKIDKMNELIREVGKKMHDLHKDICHNGLSSTSFHALKFIFEKKNPTMKELADQFGITPPSVTVLIEPLVEERYVLRDTDKHDRRVIRLSISEKGKQILKKTMQSAQKITSSILGQMDEEEVDNLYSGLNHLLTIIKK
jgi:DNA-binding MarR family transcriptional regulator